MQDNYRHQGLRKRLVDVLREKGIEDEHVLQAIGKVPRHLFMDTVFDEDAYEDKACPIGQGQTISQPYTVAYQSSILNAEKHMKVLEVGTGSGYQACVLKEMGLRVYSVERIAALYETARARFQSLGYASIRSFFRDGGNGLAEFAPFDRILVTAGAKEIPQALKEQLAINGRLIIPIGDENGHTMVIITRLESDKWDQQSLESFHFVPFLSGKKS